MPPMPQGKRYAAPASVQLQSPVRNARLRPLRSARRPAKRRLHKATTEKVPITNPTARSDPPRSWRTWGARAGKTVPKPKKPRKVAAIRHQKRPPSGAGDPIAHHCRMGFGLWVPRTRNEKLETDILKFHADPSPSSRGYWAIGGILIRV